MPTLIDGREVSSSDSRWQSECLTRHKHAAAMLSLGDREMRKQYVANVRVAEGDEAATRLKAEFARQWESRQGEGVRA